MFVVIEWEKKEDKHGGWGIKNSYFYPSNRESQA